MLRVPFKRVSIGYGAALFFFFNGGRLAGACIWHYALRRETHLSLEHEITGPSRHSRTRGSTLSGGRQHILFKKLDI